MPKPTHHSPPTTQHPNSSLTNTHSHPSTDLDGDDEAPASKRERIRALLAKLNGLSERAEYLHAHFNPDDPRQQQSSAMEAAAAAAVAAGVAPGVGVGVGVGAEPPSNSTHSTTTGPFAHAPDMTGYSSTTLGYR